jgi:hypothetical protein
LCFEPAGAVEGSIFCVTSGCGTASPIVFTSGSIAEGTSVAVPDFGLVSDLELLDLSDLRSRTPPVALVYGSAKADTSGLGYGVGCMI